MPRLLPLERLLNRTLSRSHDREVVQFEIREISSGNLIRVRFESHDSPWRQGVWLATDGLLRANAVEASQLVIWTDSAPEVTDIEVVSTDGLLRLYNVWNSDRGYSNRESQSATSGMLVEHIAPATNRYKCNDIGNDPTFDTLVFTLAIE